VRIADEIEAGFDRLVDRIRKRSTIFDHVWQALMRFIDVLAGRLAAAISYYAFFAAFSLAVLGYSILGRVVGTSDSSVLSAVNDYLQASLPWVTDTAQQVGRGEVTALAAVGLLISGVGWVEALRSSLRAVWLLDQHPGHWFLRRVVDGIFYLLQSGCQWRMLPRDFPPRSTVYGYFRAWIAAGVWAHVHDVLYRRTRELEGREESPTAAIIDSQSVKTGPDARGMVGYDAGKRIKGRKRHLVTDTLGLMLRIEVHSAGVQDRDGAALVLDRITRRFPFLERFFADAGYQGPRVAEAAPRPVEIIKRSDAGFVVQPKRWVVERTFAWASINRRLARDFERFAETAKALFQIAMIKLMARRIARFRDF